MQSKSQKRVYGCLFFHCESILQYGCSWNLMPKLITSHPLPFTAFYQQRVSWLRDWAWKLHCRIPSPAPLPGNSHCGPTSPCFTELYWTAPELLRLPEVPRSGTPKGDAYSFAIVMRELIHQHARGPLEDLGETPDGNTGSRSLAGFGDLGWLINACFCVCFC